MTPGFSCYCYDPVSLASVIAHLHRIMTAFQPFMSPLDRISCFGSIGRIENTGGDLSQGKTIACEATRFRYWT